MTGLLTELGKKIAERWLTLLFLPGALYLAVLAAAWHADGLSPAPAVHWVGELTRAQRPDSSVIVVLIVIAVLAAAAGLTASALGTLIERLWLAEDPKTWPWPMKSAALWWTARRRKRWGKAAEQERELRLRYKRGLVPDADPSGVGEGQLAAASRRVRAIAVEEPERVTWMGDRLQAPVTGYRREHALDLPSIWPHLWLVLPDAARTELERTREALRKAAVLAGWGCLYTAAVVLWPLAAAPLVLVFLTAWRRGRAAVDAYARLVDAVTRLHAPALAAALGLDHTGPLNPHTGRAMTLLVQGRSDLIELTIGWPRKDQHDAG